MATKIMKDPHLSGPSAGSESSWHIIVKNDNHNTFDSVAMALARVVPGVDARRGYEFAQQIHATGQALVWSGAREPAELYWEQLRGTGLTMAPLEKG